MSSTIREIALRTGLSTCTVSLVLRGKGRISQQNRKKVLLTAKDLDYQPNPLLSRALSLARQPEVSRYRETFAFIVEYPDGEGPLSQKQIHEGAQEKARALGYKLESFLVSGKPTSHRQLSRVLVARGIRGVIIIPRLESHQPRLYLDWKNFAAVEIERTLWSPRNLHHVENSDYHKIIDAIHLLKKVGFRRLGMAIEPMQNKHQRGIFNAAYLAAQLRLPSRQQIPPLSSQGEWSEKTLRRWMEKYKPDVLFIHDAKTICAWLKAMNLRTPEDVSLFCANISHVNDNGIFSGLRRDYRGVGRSAVEMVSLLLESEELGLVGNPRCWQVDEYWQVGTTLKHSIERYVSSEGFLLSNLQRVPPPRKSPRALSSGKLVAAR